jgi:hypothetical protein
MTTDQLTKQQIEEMRNWVLVCEWADLEIERIEGLSDAYIVRGIRQHYTGGIPKFLSDRRRYGPVA